MSAEGIRELVGVFGGLIVNVNDVIVYVCWEGDTQENEISYERAFLRWGDMIDNELSILRDEVDGTKV